MNTSNDSHGLTQWHGTTIVGIKRGDKTVIAGDGQVSMGNTVMKPNARKVRRIGAESKVVAGFAGATAAAFTLNELWLIMKKMPNRSRANPWRVQPISASSPMAI